jgi:hypothetical protein
MTTVRTPRNRDRKAPIDNAALTLFIALSKVPQRLRESDSFKDRDRDLHRRLGIAVDWLCAGASVLDGEPTYRKPGDVHYPSVVKAREVRTRLLAMAGMKADG